MRHLEVRGGPRFVARLHAVNQSLRVAVGACNSFVALLCAVADTENVRAHNRAGLCDSALSRHGLLSNIGTAYGREHNSVNRIGTSPRVRILLVDDHGIVRDALAMLLERQYGMSVVGSAENGADAVSAALRLKPDLILMDLVLCDMNGADATRRILTLLPKTRVIALSACHTTEQVVRALRAGARGYVVKDARGAELLQAISAVMSGGQFLSPGITPLLVDGMLGDSQARNPMETLSWRERQVLKHLVAGATSANIAAQLSISRKTVDTYRGRLMTKLGAGNRAVLIRMAIEHELMAL